MNRTHPALIEFLLALDRLKYHSKPDYYRLNLLLARLDASGDPTERSIAAANELRGKGSKTKLFRAKEGPLSLNWSSSIGKGSDDLVNGGKASASDAEPSARSTEDAPSASNSMIADGPHSSDAPSKRRAVWINDRDHPFECSKLDFAKVDSKETLAPRLREVPERIRKSYGLGLAFDGVWCLARGDESDTELLEWDAPSGKRT